MPAGHPHRLLFICMGNICRSPLAANVFRHKAVSRGVLERFEIESAGTGAWHVGQPPDPRVLQTAAPSPITGLFIALSRPIRAASRSAWDERSPCGRSKT